jgi:hypothetical protein
MRSRFLRSLVLGCGLLLALPPGWCCTFALRAAKQGISQGPPKATPCCCPCCAKEAPPPAPTPTPAPKTPDRCPCADRHSTAPDAPKVFASDPGLVTPLPAIDLAPSWPGISALVGFRSPAAPTSSHVLNCVWLC